MTGYQRNTACQGASYKFANELLTPYVTRAVMTKPSSHDISSEATALEVTHGSRTSLGVRTVTEDANKRVYEYARRVDVISRRKKGKVARGMIMLRFSDCVGMHLTWAGSSGSYFSPIAWRLQLLQ